MTRWTDLQKDGLSVQAPPLGGDPTQAPAGGAIRGQPRVGHVVELKILFGVLVGLLILTWVTVAASWVDLGNWNVVIAIAIACVKASLVALFFMHLFWDKRFNAVVFVSSIAFLSIFIALSLMDKAEYHPQLDKGDGSKVIEKLNEER